MTMFLAAVERKSGKEFSLALEDGDALARQDFEGCLKTLS